MHTPCMCHFLEPPLTSCPSFAFLFNLHAIFNRLFFDKNAHNFLLPACTHLPPYLQNFVCTTMYISMYGVVQQQLYQVYTGSEKIMYSLIILNLRVLFELLSDGQQSLKAAQASL